LFQAHEVVTKEGEPLIHYAPWSCGTTSASFYDCAYVERHHSCQQLSQVCSMIDKHDMCRHSSDIVDRRTEQFKGPCKSATLTILLLLLLVLLSLLLLSILLLLLLLLLLLFLLFVFLPPHVLIASRSPSRPFKINIPARFLRLRTSVTQAKPTCHLRWFQSGPAHVSGNMHFVLQVDV
jgi:hypothetical protein